ncbi:MAG: hypothetical protein GZ088_15685 [Acidipila sp.]|nr:hypothetical protein [Acidipila sp.]
MNRVLSVFGMCALLVATAALAQDKATPLAKSPSATARVAAHAGDSNTAALEDAAAPASTSAAKLPVRRVVLYKNGVGYFEHLGRVRGNGSLSIDFNSGQLNDVLKSLTVLDLGGGRITGVDYNSEEPLARRLGGLRLPLGEQTTLVQFLGALRGARLEVRTGSGTITGRLLSVEHKTRATKDGQVIQYDEISLVSDAGEVRSAELGPATSVRIVERDLNAEVGRYMGLVASTRLQDVRRMTISTSGAGDRQIYVSYISEVPLWKTTYRVVLPSKAAAKPLLQGWAIVDNTVGEDWNGVELSLVAGAPQSFIQQLSQPYYGRRPVVPLPESVQLTPQTHSATLIPGHGKLSGKVTDSSGAAVSGATVRAYDENNNVVATASTDEEGQYSFQSLSAGNYRVEVEQTGFKKYVADNISISGGEESKHEAELAMGASSQSTEISAEAVMALPAAPMTKSKRGASGGIMGGLLSDARSDMMPVNAATIASARAAEQAAAQARELGDLFEYKLKQPVTIRKNQSALVPILQSEIGAEKVSLWNEGSGTPRPLRALWITNSSGLTLDGGSFSVLEDETFSGEGLLDAIKPGEKRLLSYAADLGVRIEGRSENQSQPVTRVQITHGVLIQHSELREKKIYTVRNEDTTARTVVIEHPRRTDYKLAPGLEPAETVAGFYRYRLVVEPKKTAELAVEEVRQLDTRYALTNLTDDQISFFLQQKTINPEVEQALRRIVAQKNVIAGIDAEIRARDAETQRIFADQQRLRENMKALKGTAEEKALLLRYTRQLDEQESRLEALRQEHTALEQKKLQAQAELNKMIEQLSVDSAL